MSPFVHLEPAEHGNIRKEHGGHKDWSGLDDDDRHYNVEDDVDDNNNDVDKNDNVVDGDDQVALPPPPPLPGPGFADIFKTPKRFSPHRHNFQTLNTESFWK